MHAEPQLGGLDDDLARWAQTISYEILSRLGPRLSRIHLPGETVQESL
jgi:hypothetical protein